MTESTAPATADTKATNPEMPCQCYAEFAYFLDGEDGYLTEEAVYGECGRGTKNTFAPGHDAKLKSALIAAYVAGTDIHRVMGGLLISADPMAVAMERDWDGFLVKARNVATAKARKSEAAKQAREAKRAATLAKREARKAERALAKAEDAADDATIEAAHAAADAEITIEDAHERNLQVGTLVEVTVRGRKVSGEVVKLDKDVARVEFLTIKGERAIAVKPLRDLVF